MLNRLAQNDESVIDVISTLTQKSCTAGVQSIWLFSNQFRDAHVARISTRKKKATRAGRGPEELHGT